jgi:FkbM family methyltransferase
MNVSRRCRYGMMTYNVKDMWQGRSLDMYGEYMESEISVIKEVLKTGDLALDIGAGIGTHTLPMSKFVGQTGRIVAIEPERFSFYHLCGAISTNSVKNVYCFQQAIGKERKLVRVPELNDETTINYGAVTLDQPYTDVASYQIQMHTIDKLNLDNCNFIKIDVEGMEIDVLEGGKNTINKFKPIIYAENDTRCNEAVQKFMLDLDYDVYIHTAPLFNPDNFYSENRNVFIADGGSIYVSSMLLCLPREKASIIDTSRWSMEKIRYANEKCSLIHRGQGTTTLSVPTRIRHNDFKKYLFGSGIDIGGGYDTLQTPHGTVRSWDIKDGDAVYMHNVPDNSYDFVYSSHCLEHLTDVLSALKNWVRILKTGGYLFVAVPDWELYEQKNWPSKFNTDHKATFSTRVKKEDVGRNNHYNIEEDIIPILHSLGITMLELRIEDDRYNYQIQDVDQTGPAFNALAQICFIGKKIT